MREGRMALPFFKGGKQMIRKMIRKIDSMKAKTAAEAGMILAMIMMAFPMNVFAAGEEVVAGINSLEGLLANIVTAIGTIIILWGIFELGTAQQSHDPAQTPLAIKRITGGLIMFFAPQILILLKQGVST